MHFVIGTKASGLSLTKPNWLSQHDQPTTLHTLLIQWHREKAGTIEAVHDVLKNDLAGGVMPSKYFGANAAWLRLAVISYNVLTALKRIALPAELLRARPKRLRFLIINTAGRLVQHARKMRLRLAAIEQRIALWKEAMRLLPVAT